MIKLPKGAKVDPFYSRLLAKMIWKPKEESSNIPDVKIELPKKEEEPDWRLGTTLTNASFLKSDGDFLVDSENKKYHKNAFNEYPSRRAVRQLGLYTKHRFMQNVTHNGETRTRMVTYRKPQASVKKLREIMEATLAAKEQKPDVLDDSIDNDLGGI